MTNGASGPINIAIAPAPPVGLALPTEYTALSAATTRASLPSQALLSTHATALKSAAVPP